MNRADKKFTLTDFHSHILCHMDDGSADADESLAMLAASYGQGVRRLVFSPHFYAEREGLDAFLARRAAAAEEVLNALRGAEEREKLSHIRFHLGAEVAYFRGISRAADIDELCVQGTRTMLVEMPFARWGKDEIEEIFALRDQLGILPVLAHVERYLPFGNKRALYEMARCEIPLQSNAEFFIEKATRKKALKLLSKGLITILGSDSHNMRSRKPCLGEAAATIGGAGLVEDLWRLEDCAEGLLMGATPLKV